MNGTKRTWWGAALAAALALTLAGSASAGNQEKAKAKERAREFTLLGGPAWLGVRINEVTAETVQAKKLPGEYGVVVDEVESESPAGKAGLKSGDVILTFAEERVRGVAHLQRLLRETPAGRQVEVQVSRDGRTQTLAVTPEARSARMWMPEIEIPRIEIAPMPEIRVNPDFDFQMFVPGGYRLGVSAEDLNTQLAAYFGVSDGRGVLVKEVVEGSPAAKAGLKAGDVILRVDEADINSVNDLRRSLRQEREGNRATLTIMRERREQKITVELEETRRPGRRRIALAPGAPPAPLAPRAPMAPRGPMAVQPPQPPQPPEPDWDHEMEFDEYLMDEQELDELGREIEREQRELQERYQLEMEEFHREMQEAQEELQREFDSEQHRREMERRQEELRQHEREMRRHQDEMRRQLEKARREASWV